VTTSSSVAAGRADQFSTRRQRPRIDHDDRGGHHVRRQCLVQSVTQQRSEIFACITSSAAHIANQAFSPSWVWTVTMASWTRESRRRADSISPSSTDTPAASPVDQCGQGTRADRSATGQVASPI